MDKFQLKNKIDNNNKKLEEMINPAVFVLNPEVQALLMENDQLRSACKHEFENGFCKWCYTKEEE